MSLADIAIQIGEFATDYIEVRRDYTDWTPQYQKKSEADSELEAPPAAGNRHGVPDDELARTNSLPHSNGQAKAGNGNLAPISEKPESDGERNGLILPGS